ncbi:hypothetical protein H2508_05925 [Parahaliea sp. F7430]|uniref:Peptidase M61 catalytic domain-containing protein n=1 Tax=Sediminihaliea albiluteola TaxID=2758564 RepID=A0A7W2TVC3_9GAMM|nr:hypothetical protein [Sediminihaliea albiluteola]MBA6412647.1 hypothetical protein [Sediminihaliea albiluteola]
MKLIPFIWLTIILVTQAAAAAPYDIDYQVSVDPQSGLAQVTVALTGKELPSRLTLHIDPQRHLNFASEQPFESDDDELVWRPQAPTSKLRYDFVIDNKKGRDSYDSMITADWAVLRSDKLIPPIAAKAKSGLKSRATLLFKMPDSWSSAAPYEALQEQDNHYRIHDPGRRFLRPKGWLILGEIASRQDIIAGTNVRVAAPRGQDIRLQDTLAFINWTLPAIKKLFPQIPSHLLIVSAPDPMWRGGLSAPNSLFMHGDRPLISGNRTSSLIHELVHVGTSIHGTQYSDWIVEGIAEYYAVQILRRTGGISNYRYEQALSALAKWGEESEELLTGSSSGATTARAVTLLHHLDLELKQKSDGKVGLDNIAKELADSGGTVTVKDFIAIAERWAGSELKALEPIKVRIED